MNIFDSIGKTAFNAIKAFAGYPATWSPKDGSPMQSANVLFKSPSEKHELSDSDYDIERYQMEYYETDFIGLMESVEDANNERVILELSPGILKQFSVKKVKRKFDGKSFIATLIPL